MENREQKQGEQKDWRDELDKIIKARCSNCGKDNEYFKEEWKRRENTLCNHCGHTLSICSGFVEDAVDLSKKPIPKIKTPLFIRFINKCPALSWFIILGGYVLFFFIIFLIVKWVQK